MARLTPKQRVLRKYPVAVCGRWTASNSWYVDLPHRCLGWGRTPRLAWADAASKFCRPKRG